MREGYTILPVPVGDVSGIASALYELGGMVVIHDPSGCNSTYNTHDELRWYDKESDIFISGLNMRDAVLGNDKKFIADIVEAAESLSKEGASGGAACKATGPAEKGHEFGRGDASSCEKAPNFIAICNSPVPFLNGTDFLGISKIVEKETGIPTFYVKSNGMHDYITGVQEAYVSFARRMLGDMMKAVYPKELNPSELSRKQNSSVIKTGDGKIRINILGATPLDYGHQDAVFSLKKRLTDDGFEVNSVWSLDTSFDEIMQTLKADVNLVISSTGIPLAELLKEKFLMPYVIGAPVTKELNEILCGNIHKAVPAEFSGKEESFAGALKTETAFKKSPFSEIKSSSKDRISIIIGESVLSASLAAGIRAGKLDEEVSDVAGTTAGQSDSAESAEDAETAKFNAGHDAIVFCPYPYKSPVMRDEDVYFDGEEELVSALEKVMNENPESEIEMIADPLYRPVIPPHVKFTELPTLAVSGRMYRSKFVNYFEFT